MAIPGKVSVTRKVSNGHPRVTVIGAGISGLSCARMLSDHNLPVVVFKKSRGVDYLIGEKFLNFLEDAERDSELRKEIPEFVAEIKKLFEPWQLKSCLERARETEPFDPDDYKGEEPEDIEMERKSDLRRCTSDLMMLESAKEWLLGDEE